MKNDIKLVINGYECNHNHKKFLETKKIHDVQVIINGHRYNLS